MSVSTSPIGRPSLRGGAGLASEPFDGRVAAVAERFGFWTAVVLPFVHVPMLVAGLPGDLHLAFVGLFVANLLGLVLGRDYDPDGRSG